MNAKNGMNNNEIDMDSNKEFDNKEFANLYIQSVHTTTKRCYWAYSALLLVCITALMAFYLEYFSYTEKYIKSANIELTDMIRNEYINKFIEYRIYTKADSIYYSKGTDVSNALLDNQIRNFVDTQYFSFPILGFKLSTSDTLFLISIFFVIVSLWCFYCVRAENFTIGKALNESVNFSFSCRKYIFQGICFNNLFFPSTLRRNPYCKLKSKLSVKEKIRDKHEKRADVGDIFVRFYRWAPKIIFCLPCVIIFFNCILHVYDISKLDCMPFSNSTNEIENELILKNLKKDLDENIVLLNNRSDTLHLNDEKVFRMNYIHQISSLKKYGSFHIILGTAITLITFFIVYIIVLGIFDYLSGTSEILYQYRRKAKHDEEIAWIDRKVNKSINIEKAFIVEYQDIQENIEDAVYLNPNLYYGTSVSGNSMDKVATELERILLEFSNLPDTLREKLLKQVDLMKKEGGALDKCNKKFYEYFLLVEISNKQQSFFNFG